MGATQAPFDESEGKITLKGNVEVDGTKTFTVGSDGSAGATTLYGNLVVGTTSNPGTSTLNGGVTVAKSGLTVSHGGITLTGATPLDKFDASACTGTFKTSSGANTISGAATFSDSITGTAGKSTNLNGHVYVGSDTNARNIITYGEIQTATLQINSAAITCSASEGSTSNICVSSR